MPKNHPYARCYIVTFCVTVLAVLSTVFALNLTVDPYRMFEIIDGKGFNHYKPAIYNRVRLLKAYEIRRLQPDSILLGTSRCHIGFRPDNPFWKAAAQRPYNAAFDGATTKEMYYYLRHADSVHPLKLVLLGLDDYHPTDAPGSARPGFDPQMLGRGRTMVTGVQFLLADIKILTSFDTFLDSFKTLHSQTDEQPVWLSRSGQRLGETFFRTWEQDYFKQGPRYYFDEIDRMEVDNRLSWQVPMKEIKVYPPKKEAKDARTSFDYIRDIIDFCRRKNIKLVIFFSPSHAHQLELDQASGSWGWIESGKRKLTALCDQFRSLGYPVKLYDMSIYSPVTTEILPPAGSHAEMKYYWDSSHFKQEVGDMVLGCILSSGGDCSIGEALTGANIDLHLKKVREGHLGYARQHPVDVENIRRMLVDFRMKYGILSTI